MIGPRLFSLYSNKELRRFRMEMPVFGFSLSFIYRVLKRKNIIQTLICDPLEQSGTIRLRLIPKTVTRSTK